MQVALEKSVRLWHSLNIKPSCLPSELLISEQHTRKKGSKYLNTGLPLVIFFSTRNP